MSTTSANNGIGCVAVIPAGVVGFAGLTDGAGPAGWRGFAELLGWFAVCMIVAALFSVLLARSSRSGRHAHRLALASVVGMSILGYEALNWLGLGAPLAAKMLFTSSMQALGVLAAVVAGAVIVKELWKAGR